MRIYKYQVPGAWAPCPFNLYIEGGSDAIVRFFGPDFTRQVCIWAEVNEHSEKRSVDFYLIGTGHDIPVGYEYRMSCKDGDYIWHLYRKI